MVAEYENVIAQIVFEHSLRIRLKAPEDKKDEAKIANMPKTPEGSTSSSGQGTSPASGATTPTIVQDDNASDVTTATATATPTRTVQGGSGSSDGKTGTQAGTSSGSTSGTRDNLPVDPPKGGLEKKGNPKSEHVVGKINNLITSDTRMIGYSYFATTLRESLSVLLPSSPGSSTMDTFTNFEL